MNVLHISNRPKVSATATDSQDTQALAYARQQRAGGVAALYLAAAYLVAMPYFLIVVDFQSLVGSAQKVAALVAHQNSMYVMYLVTYVVFGIVLAALALALWKRLAGSPSIAAVSGAVGLIWACMLVASGLVFNYGASAVIELYDKSPAQAVSAWQAIEPVAEGLESAQGELLGGLWVLLVSLAALRTAESAQGPELARDPDRHCGDCVCHSGSAERPVGLRHAPDRLVHLGGHCHVPHQSV